MLIFGIIGDWADIAIECVAFRIWRPVGYQVHRGTAKYHLDLLSLDP
jgi:hypothetical protein